MVQKFVMFHSEQETEIPLDVSKNVLYPFFYMGVPPTGHPKHSEHDTVLMCI